MAGSAERPFIEKWELQLRKGVLEFLVLLCLREQEYHGYGLISRIQALASGGIAEGTIYPLLNRLQREGLVSFRWEIMASGPARKYYRVTRKGRSMVKTMRSSWVRLDIAVSELAESE